jgi:hypothetical protein
VTGATFKLVPGWESYAVSTDGEVMRVAKGRGTRTGTVRTFSCHRKGYRRVNLFHRGKAKQFWLHQLVALTWIGPPPFPRAVVRHLDGDPTNNRLSNLRYGTQSENERDKVRHKYGMPPV